MRQNCQNWTNLKIGQNCPNWPKIEQKLKIGQKLKIQQIEKKTWKNWTKLTNGERRKI